MPVRDGPLEFRLVAEGTCARSARRTAGDEPWNPAGPGLGTTLLSDESATRDDPKTGRFRPWGFTGAFDGRCAQDLTGAGAAADFDGTRYREAAAERPAGT
ncbi:hypothetical protein [Streptomyces sp. NPDC059651]|uniref:beta-xylosidase family glycoside hydrolase n=1 Tax=Streptomyces sp. NPDC059651 TaxID=3346897 RepID=UPI0036A64BC7